MQSQYQLENRLWKPNRSHLKYKSDDHMRLYNKYTTIIAKCYGTSRLYSRIGGSGIKLCDRWRDPIDGFKNFVNDMLPTFENNKNHDNSRVVRKNISEDFNADNCEWKTPKEARAHNVNSGLYKTLKTRDYLKRYCEVCSKEIRKPNHLSQRRYLKRRFCSQACHWGKPFIIPEGREGMYKKVTTAKNNEVYYTKETLDNRNQSITAFTDALKNIIKKGGLSEDLLNRTKEVLKQFS